MFTSAGSVYPENSGGEVDESSELAAGPRSSTLIEAERPVLAKVKDYAEMSAKFLGMIFVYCREPQKLLLEIFASKSQPTDLGHAYFLSPFPARHCPSSQATHICHFRDR